MLTDVTQKARPSAKISSHARSDYIAAELQLLKDNEKVRVIDSFAKIAKAYRGDESDFVKALPDTLGLR